MQIGNGTFLNGDCLEVMRSMAANSVDSICTDPPYGLSAEPDMVEVMRHWMAGDDYTHRHSGFMGRSWDSFVPGPAIWREALRVLKPGGHLAAFFGTRTYDIGTLAIRLAGFEIRDQLAWVYGSGFPKSLDVSKAIDKAAGAKGTYGEAKTPAHAEMLKKGVARRGVKQEGWDRPWMDDPESISNSNRKYVSATPEAAQWQGWGTALKPAYEPICLARKPLIGTVAANVLAHGVGGLNIDGCRVGDEVRYNPPAANQRAGVAQNANILSGTDPNAEGRTAVGRWPANLVHDGSEEVLAGFPDDGSAARFFYCAKASRSDRSADNNHPTVKPTALMEWLCRLITPPGGLVLDPFMGSGSTGKAAHNEGFRFTGIERDPDYYAMAVARIWEHVSG